MCIFQAKQFISQNEDLLLQIMILMLKFIRRNKWVELTTATESIKKKISTLHLKKNCIKGNSKNKPSLGLPERITFLLQLLQMQGKTRLLFYKALDYNKDMIEKLMIDVSIYPENLNDSHKLESLGMILTVCQLFDCS